MKRDVELALLDRAVAGLAARAPVIRVDAGAAAVAGTTGADGTAVTRAPVDYYASRAQLERERATLFRTLPLAVGFASQVRSPGSFLTRAVGDVPVLVSRSADDGVLRAFVNACRHRGTRLEDAPCGEGRRAGFVCPYHAWSYDGAGRLRGLPHPEGFPGLDRDAHGLVPLSVEERCGLVFVTPSPGASSSSSAFFHGVVDDLAPFADHVLFAPSTRTKRMNWKLLADSSFETYHFRITHADTIAPLFFDNAGVFDWTAPHARIVMPKRSIEAMQATARDTWSLRDNANVLYGVFPNTIFLVQPDHAMVVTAWPVDVDVTEVSAGMLIPEAPATQKARAHWEKNEQIFWRAIEEDLTMCERMQATMRADPGGSLVFGTFERLASLYRAEVLARSSPG